MAPSFKVPLSPLPELDCNNDTVPLIQGHSRDSSASGVQQRIPRKPLPSESFLSISLCDGLDRRSSLKTLQDDVNEKVNRSHLPAKPFKKQKSWQTSLAAETLYGPVRLRIGWRRILKHFGVFSALAVIIIASLSLLAFIAFSGSRQLSLYISGLSIDIPSCETLGVSGSGSWTFVGIDVRFGPLSYGQAKAADLAWNMIAGRGVATLLAILSYRVFTDALMKATEAHCVPYEVFTSLALFSTRLDKLWYLGKGLFQSPGWRVKWMIGWIFVSTIHLALFPTLMDILSGYEASNVTQLRLPSNGSILLTRSTLRRISPYNNNTLWTAYPIPGSNLMTYQWHDQTLNKSWAESVNSTFIVEYWNATYSTDDSSHAAWEKFQNDAKNFYMYNPDNYDCVLEPAVYQWGFSAEWAYVLVIVNSCWLVGLWIVWVDADHNSQLCRKRRRMGTYRAIADISEAMREDLGRNLCAYSEDELRKAVRKQGFIKYYVSNEEDGMPAHLGLSSRPSGKVKLEWGQKYGQG